MYRAFNEQQEGHFQTHQWQKEESNDKQQVANIHLNDFGRSVDNCIKPVSSHDDEIESCRVQSRTKSMPEELV